MGSVSLTLEQIKEHLGLRPHPEGGFYLETWRSPEKVGTDRHHALEGVRSAGTTIYYLLTRASPKGHLCHNMSECMHIWCGGGAQKHHFIHEDGSLEEHALGPRLDLGQKLQVLCPSNTWKCSSLLDDTEWSLITEVVYPGWELADFEMGREDKLLEMFPQHRNIIEKYAHKEDVGFD